MTARTKSERPVRRTATKAVATRRVTFGGANSLDNFIARPDHAVDWLMWSNEAGDIMKDYWSTVDTIIMGRKTYEVAAKSGQGGGGFPGVSTYIFSRTLNSAPKGATLVSEDVADFVRRLKQEPGRGLFTGGVTLPKALAELGLIDEYELIVHPRLAGHGPTLFAGLAKHVDLKLVDRLEFDSGAVAMRYEPSR